MSDEYPVCPVCGSNSGQGCTADCMAAEIAKLQADLAAWKRIYENSLSFASRMRAVIFKLRADLAAWKGIHEGAVAAMNVEITKLRAEVERLKGNIESWRRIPGKVAETYEADIVRLTAALESISRVEIDNDHDQNRTTIAFAKDLALAALQKGKEND